LEITGALAAFLPVVVAVVLALWAKTQARKTVGMVEMG
jgi:hypothetical protein